MNNGGIQQNGNSDEELSHPTTEQLNMRCTGVKRLLKEAIELREPNELFCAKPLEDNLFEWHFTVRGPPDTVYADGVYHGRIILPAEYPMKPPNLILLTPNGRFETNKKICLSISGYHPETWLPSWSIRTALLALIGFMPTHSAGALGGLECSQEERRRLAIKSRDWHCDQCGLDLRGALPPLGAAPKESTRKLLQEVQTVSVPPQTSSKTTGTSDNIQAAKLDKQKEQMIATGLTGGETQAKPQQIPHSSPLNAVGGNRTLGQTSGEQQNSLQPDQQISTSAAAATSGGNGQLRENLAITRTRRFGPVSSIFESPIFWIFLLSSLFFVLLLRRLLLSPSNSGGSYSF